MPALISAADLMQSLDDPCIKIIDATYPLNPDIHLRTRIGNATPFNIDAIADHKTELPHMLPDAAGFSAAVGAMGIGNNDTVIVYDQSGMTFAAARVWWMFRCFGHDNVRVLDGGLPAWMSAGYPVASDLPVIPTPARYEARFRPELVRDKDQINNSLGRPDTLIIDARPVERFAGRAGEPRPGMRAGHIPGSINIPFQELTNPATGLLNSRHPEVLKAAKSQAEQIITSCGSGVTACLLALALYQAGRPDAAVYDGSWAEWGRESARLPVEA